MLARELGSIDRLLGATVEELQAIDGIGPDRATSIAEWFDDKANRMLVELVQTMTRDGFRLDGSFQPRPMGSHAGFGLDALCLVHGDGTYRREEV